MPQHMRVPGRLPKSGQVSPYQICFPRRLHARVFGLAPSAQNALLGTAPPADPGVFSGNRTRNCPFACPFYKFNPAMCDGCKKFEFYRIPDMKQHLIRCHSLPGLSELSCQICHSILDNEESRTLHLCDGSCQALIGPEQLSPEEVEKLKRTRFPRGYCGVRQWFAIWRQIFPCHDEPQSPYLQPNNVEEVISLISPTVEAYLNAAFPTLPEQAHQNHSHLALGSSVKAIMENVCRDFCTNLPTSRHKPLVKSSDSAIATCSQVPRMNGQVQPQPHFQRSPYNLASLSESLSVEDQFSQLTPANTGGSDSRLLENAAVNDAGSSSACWLANGPSTSLHDKSDRKIAMPTFGTYLECDDVYSLG